MAEIPDYLQLVFSEALKALRKKVPMPAKDWREFSGESQNWAFTVAGLTQGDLLQDILTLIDQAFAQGKSTENFVEEFEQLVSDRGWTEGRDRGKFILENNIRSVQRQGRYEQVRDPDVATARPYLMWKHRDSRVPRPLHLALHRQVFRADDPFWLKAFPSCGFGCRCAAYAVSDRDLRRLGLSVGVPPDPATIADPGWDYQPNIPGQRQYFYQKKMQALDKKLQQIIEENDRKNREN